MERNQAVPASSQSYLEDLLKGHPRAQPVATIRTNVKKPRETE